MDGAGRWTRLRRIVLPLIAPTFLLLVFRDTISSLQDNFAPALIVTKGGPHYATLFLPLKIYTDAFQNFRFGFASAMIWVLYGVTALSSSCNMPAHAAGARPRMSDSVRSPRRRAPPHDAAVAGRRPAPQRALPGPLGAMPMGSLRRPGLPPPRGVEGPPQPLNWSNFTAVFQLVELAAMRSTRSPWKRSRCL